MKLNIKKGKHLAQKSHKAKKITAVILSVALLLGIALPVAVAATEPNTPKQEVVYINLNADGSVEKVYVVNIFELDKDGKIVDYGDYTALRNMTSNDDIEFKDQTVRIDTKEDKLYYEGILSENSIPWDFTVKYYLDEKEYSAEQLAGKSGAFKLNISVKQNSNCDSTFFKNYSLQATVTLDTEKCKNIVADGAVMANAGKNKQLSYMILPNSETDITVTADVTDFEMSGISINGVPLSINVDLDIENNSELNSQIDELNDATAQLDNGANDLKNGADDLKDGTSELAEGANDIKDGASDLTDGAEKLKDGASDLADGAKNLDGGVSNLKNGADELLNGSQDLSDGAFELDGYIKEAAESAGDLADGISNLKDGSLKFDAALNELYGGLNKISGSSDQLINAGYTVFKQLCSEAQAQINTALSAFGMPQITLTPENYTEVLNGILLQIGDNFNETKSQITALKEQLDGYQAFYSGLKEYTLGVDSASKGAGELTTAYDGLLNGIDSLQAGSTALFNGLKQIEQGSAELLSGTVVLSKGATAVSNGIITLSDGSAELLNGAVDLKNGTVALYDGAVELKDGSIDLLGGAISLKEGAVKLYDGTVELKNGTFEFKDKTSDLKTKLSDKIKSAVDDILGGNFEVKSFVSSKNTNVDSVQFVIKTPSIEIQESEKVAAEPEKELNFWQRLLNLFGLYND